MRSGDRVDHISYYQLTWFTLAPGMPNRTEDLESARPREPDNRDRTDARRCRESYDCIG
jgi:hypothetical protein